MNARQVCVGTQFAYKPTEREAKPSEGIASFVSRGALSSVALRSASRCAFGFAAGSLAAREISIEPEVAAAMFGEVMICPAA
jgi:hypothetical protein